MKRICAAVIVGILSFSECCQCHGQIMFWNVENFFDCSDDPLTNDDDFTPKGYYRWCRSHFLHKRNMIAKTIVAAADSLPPPVVALAEVENRYVIEELLKQTVLAKFDYAVIHRNSPDPRGIDVAILYDRGRFRLLEKEFIPADTLRTREIVRARGVMGCDTIDVLATHWPSKLHGSSPSDWRRATVAAILLKKVDSLENAGHHKILIVGDFNDTPDSPIFSLLNSKMVNLSSEAAAQGLGSLRYKGRWELIDQALASKNLAREKIFFKIFSPPFILEPDKRYLGQKPFRSHIGPRYNGGVSDHLPIIITW